MNLKKLAASIGLFMFAVVVSFATAHWVDAHGTTSAISFMVVVWGFFLTVTSLISAVWMIGSALRKD